MLDAKTNKWPDFDMILNTSSIPIDDDVRGKIIDTFHPIQGKQLEQGQVLESDFEPTGIPDHEDVDRGTEAESRQRCKTLNHEWQNIKRKRKDERLLEKRREKELIKRASIADFIEMN